MTLSLRSLSGHWSGASSGVLEATRISGLFMTLKLWLNSEFSVFVFFLMFYYYMRLLKRLDYYFTVKISKDIFLSFLKASICSLAEEENMAEPQR